jgi:photosystem II stability/assembly factor-like uncharacterized protein
MPRLLALALALFFTSAFAWTTHGPTGGTILAIAQAPSDARILYVTTHAGIFRSDDAGASWRDVTNGVTGAVFVAVDPTDPNRVYVTTFTGVARSSDGGASWSTTVIPGSQFAPSGLIVDRIDPRILDLGSHCDAELGGSTATGFFRSTDRGVTWSRIPTPGPSCISELAIDPVSSDVYAWEDDGPVLRLAHGASTLEKVAPPLPTHAIVADVHDPSIRYGISSFFFTLVASSDNGATWSAVGPRVSGIFRTLVADPATGRLFLGTSSGLFRSGNGGQSWASVDTLPPLDVTGVIVAADSITVGTEGGIFRTTDGMVTWTRIETGGTGTAVRQILIDPANPASVWASADGLLFHSPDLGNSWTYAGPGQRVLAIDAAGQLFGGPYAGHAIYRLDPDGWHHLFDTPGTISSLVTDANVPGTFWINSLDAIHVTRDGGATFQIVSRPSPFAYALFGDPRRSNVLYTIADALYQSTDGAVTWKRLGSTRGLPFVTAPPSDSSFVYVWSYSALGRAATDGSDAVILTTPMGGLTDLVVDPHDAKTLYAATVRGVERSTDGGLTWAPFGDLNLNAFVLATDREGLDLHAGTDGHGIWEQPLVKTRRRPAR